MKKLLFTVLTLALAVPAFAIDIPMPDGMKLNMYGQVRFAAQYIYKDHKPDGGDSVTDYSDLYYRMQGNSRFGIMFTAGGFKANVETNFNNDGVSVGNGFGFRQFWGSYTFDNGLTFTAGNKTTITGNSDDFSDVYDTDNGIDGYGNIGHTRRNLIMFSYVGLDFALVSNERDHAGVAYAGTSVDASGNTVAVSGVTSIKENYIPRIELAYNLKFNNLRGKVFGTYGLYTESTDNTNYVDVHAWHVGTYLQPTFDKMYIKFGAFYGMNVNMYGATKAFIGRPTITKDGDGDWDVENVGTFGVGLAFGMRNIVSNLSAELGGGYSLTSYDLEGLEDLNTYSVYVQTPYRFNQYLLLIPQVGYYGRSQDKTADWNEIMAGVELRVLF